MSETKVRICGLTTPDTVRVAAECGADFLGFVFHKESPRNISIADAIPLVQLARSINPDIQIVAVVVNPSDALIVELQMHLSPDYIQLHGNESVERVKEIKTLGT